ncbi:protein RALF-like 34 [Elaeis guineensis]|uniref:Protein RALF-like 34 n=1 Tax=Elaeis guineensis var. tenera TaxID=51953 RepID=A0A6I9QNK8_ELAGV|nr:protein RALF-like 34 [Elaeis guineensis]
MAFPNLFSFSLLLFVLFLSSSTHNVAVVEAQADDTSWKLRTDAMEWPTTTSLYSSSSSYPFGYEADEEGLEEAAKHNRRALFWHRFRYYISYGALSANRVPCPPRSGRSYYTHNCYRARGPVHPYHRGCSAITRCRR